MSDVPELAERSPARYSALRTDTEYEQFFVDHVLEPLDELISWQVKSQESVVVGGRTYRVDFALHRPPWRIAIEIDGENKGPNAPSHDEWTRRQTSLVSAGWEVLRFTNRQVMHEQEYCRRQLAVAMARLHEEDKPPPVATTTAVPSTRGRGPAIAVAGAAVVAVAVAGALVLNSRSAGDDRYPCPPSEPVKGNVSASGERIYHQRGDDFYNRTDAEECFPDADAAEVAGFRPTRR
jgi:very-short-patch-repair endonuclease